MTKVHPAAVAALVLGALSVIVGLFPVFGQMLTIAAMITGIVGIVKTKGTTDKTGLTFSIIGLVLGAIIFLISLVILVFYVGLFALATTQINNGNWVREGEGLVRPIDIRGFMEADGSGGYELHINATNLAGFEMDGVNVEFHSDHGPMYECEGPTGLIDGQTGVYDCNTATSVGTVEFTYENTITKLTHKKRGVLTLRKPVSLHAAN